MNSMLFKGNEINKSVLEYFFTILLHLQWEKKYGDLKKKKPICFVIHNSCIEGHFYFKT